MPYEILRGNKPNLNHLHEFGSTCFLLNYREHMRKFDPKSDEGMFLDTPPNIKAYRVYNKCSKNLWNQLMLSLMIKELSL